MGITKTPFSYFRATLATWEKLANRNLLHIFALRFVWPNFTIHFFFFGIPNKQFDALHTTNFHLFPNFLPLLINLRIRIFRLLQQFALINAYKLVAFMYSANVTLEIHRVTTCQNYFNAILIYFFRFSRTNLLHSLVISLISKNLEKTVPTFRYLTLGLFRLTTRWNF